MAGIFTKRIWQPCICAPNEFNGKLRKNWGGQTGAKQKIWGAMAHPGPPLESPLYGPRAKSGPRIHFVNNEKLIDEKLFDLVECNIS